MAKQNRDKVLFVGLRFAHEFYLTRHKKLFSGYYEVISIHVDTSPVLGKFFRRRSFFRIPIELILLFIIVARHRPKHIISIGPKVGFLVSIVSLFFPRCSSTHWFTGQFWANSDNKVWEKSYWIDKAILKLSDNTLCDGPSQSQFLLRELSKTKEVKSIIPGSINGVDDKFFELPLRETHNGSFRICFVGRKAVGKGLEELIVLAQECQKLSMKVEFIVAGPIDESFKKYGEWRSEVSDYLDNVTFIDDLVNPVEIFATCDAFILLSEREGFSGTVIQAQASGLPVICSDVYGLKDTFADGVTGFSAAPSDTVSLILAIEHLLCPKNYCLMSRASRSFALEFAEGNFLKCLSDAYRKVGFDFGDSTQY